ncbi:MAG: CHAP domain-containing protein [Patescibacteria group bacterium]|nr:CHAP domain-containing protein [Patescibacteria group bacterium]
MIKKLILAVFVIGTFICFISESSAVEYCCGLNSPGNPFVCGPHDNNPNRYGNCTWYAAYKRPDVTPPCLGNASSWFDQANNGGLSTGQIPSVGSIVVFNWYNNNNVNIGHVAYVEQVNSDNSFNITEMGWNSWDCVHTNTYKKGGNELGGIIGFIYYPHHQVLKFSDSSDCYLQSNGQLWPISSEQVYSYLGFTYDDCNFVANWDYLTEFDASQRGNYVIRQETILSLSNPSIGKNIAYRVIEKVGPYVCSSMYVDPTKIYLFGDDNQFHHIANEQIYYDLGYSDDWDDVVEISPDLFMLYGESYAINNTGDALWISSSYAVSVPLSSNNWTYRVGHAFSDSIFGGGENATIKYQGQEVSLLQAINNGWIYYKAYCYDNVSFYDFEIAYGQFVPGNQYFIYSFVSGAEFALYGSFESVDDKQSVQDMDSIAENDSRFLFKELYSLEIVPDWSPYWTLRVMAYQVSPSSHAWFNHATSVSDSSIRYVAYRDPDTGQWTNWQRIY